MRRVVRRDCPANQPPQNGRGIWLTCLINRTNTERRGGVFARYAAAMVMLLVCAPLGKPMGLGPSAPGMDQGDERIRTALPGRDWSLEVEATGFAVKENHTLPDGRQYLLAENATTGVELSVFLESARRGTDGIDCPVHLHQNLQSLSKAGMKPESVKASEINSMSVMEYFIPEFEGKQVQQKNLIACTTNGNVYVDVHISKAGFQDSDEPMLVDTLKSIQFAANDPLPIGIAPKVNGSTAAPGAAKSLDYFAEGSRLFLTKDYKGAIEPYQKSLDLEKKNPQLSKNYWRVLVDNLGMAYGITGDLTHAEETFRYGINKDPDYPMFYYNMACTYAERQDMNMSMEYLKKAYARKANSIEGEGVPDPRTDESFQKFMTNEKFRKFADGLAGETARN